MKFLKCEVCGKVVEVVKDTQVPLMCCGRPMQELVANTQDGAHEKHIPVVDVYEDRLHIKVGEVEHPMEKDHYIMWIAQVSDNRTTRVRLYPEQSTETRFPYIKDATIYAYCNKHGLWKTKI